MAKNKTNELALALLRVVLGIIFTYHGYTKLFVSGGFTGTIQFFAAIGIPLPTYAALLVSVVEFVGGLCLVFGLLTKWSTLLLIINMLVAFFSVHLKNGFSVSKGGYEFVLLILAALVVVLVNGAGKLSLGKLFRSRHLK